TFAGAVAKVREIKASKTDGDIVVAFKAGNYGPIEAELTAEDGGSPDQQIVYCKYGDGDVVFDNGLTIGEDEFEPISEDERAMFQTKFADKIKKVDLSSRLGEIPDVSSFAMFSDDGICTLARFPDKYDDGSDHYVRAAETYDKTNLYVYLSVLTKRLAVYDESRIPEMLLYGYIVRGYRKDTFTVEKYDAETQLLTVGYGSSGEFGKKLRDDWRDSDGQGIRMIVMNVPYELDCPGEYWIDKSTGTLYVYDPSGNYRVPMAHGEKKLRGIVNYDTGDAYNASEGYCAIFAEDTGYVTLRGFHFTNNVDEFIIGYKTSGFEIDRCTFDCCTGKNQILFEKSLPDEPLGLRVTDCEFDLCVGRHVFVFDEARGPGRFTDRSDVLVDNCLFRRSNLVYDAEGAVNLFSCSGGLVSHNRFENCYRYAVMFTWSCDVIVEYNDFDSAMTNSDDGGVTRGCDDVLGNNIVRYNFYNTCTNIGHYCDNGDCGTVMYSNLFYYGGSVVYHGPCRDNVLKDNVMIGESVGGIVGSATHTDENGNVTADQNEWLRNQWVNAFLYCDTVPGYREALEERKPGATNIILDYDRAADPNFFVAPVNTFIGNLFINKEAETKLTLLGNAPDYCTVEGNVAYSFNENPIFVNPTIGDYRIRGGVDFPDIRFEEIGRY
ncbi:MAG: right-handed parallel beta-helix repeat-containing protein, partial [Clostridia bacterium]|nr:right-handed parallel beta-helix repeat-containing protein [Clostridia bacterium]